MTNHLFIASDHPLAIHEQRTLRDLVAVMIPASSEYAIPGADDEIIFADILATLVPMAAVVRQALQHLNRLAGSAFADLDPPAQREAGEQFRASGSPLVAAVAALVVQCYYRDDRVMRSLDMEPRPPFPLGFEIEEGDWALLDPVRARPKMYRDPPKQ